MGLWSWFDISLKLSGLFVETASIWQKRALAEMA